MNDYYSSIFLLISEIGILLILILGTVLVVAKKRKMRDKALAMVLVDKIKNSEPKKRENLLTILKEEYGYDDEKAEEKIEVLIGFEKTVYDNLLKTFLKKDREAITKFDGHLNDLIGSYKTIHAGQGQGDEKNDNQEGETKSSKVTLMREENTDLRVTNAKLKKDLDAAMQTMESMMSEYASMYEGGKKDGEQRMKNEMFKLKQVMEKGADVNEGDATEEVGDLEIELDAVDSDADEKNEK
ncbi:hypothetical protein MNBD_GAMMA25-1161 [hydrothermal vent metagenome]|uniref:Uncharacterized protein n=1 Tax=hydrothermal vent metagenome TaxID=652676 RepID=A0A3B1B1G4_9ZZZZ